MTALSADKLTYKVGNTERIPPVKASTLIHRGAMVAVDATGHAVPITEATGLSCIGVAMYEADNGSGANGDILVQVESGTFPMENSAGADELTWADVELAVYGVDDQTVAKTDNGGSRSAVGVLHAIGKDGKPLIRFNS